ncbi:MAG TPA: hypothetical protein VND22_03765 [Actinomycetota bacterium]|nr:hypothetical protein [Actinomycetota bacterium]
MKLRALFDDVSASASSAGLNGEWALYVAVLFPVLLGPGILGLAGFMIALSAGWILSGSAPPWLRYAGPAAPLLVLNFTSSATVAVAAGLLAGAAARAGRRVPASLQGVFGSPNWGGVVESFAVVVVVVVWGYRYALLIAAALLLLAARGEGTGESRVLGSNAAVHSALALAFVAGMRIIEVAFGGDPTSGLFFVAAWSAGSYLGWRWGERADPRAILSAPFVAAIALAALGIVRGPGTLFLYTGIAAVVSFVFRGTTETEGAESHRAIVIAAVVAGTLWAADTGRSFDTTLWVAGGLAVAGGFMSLISAYRLTPSPAGRAAGVAAGSSLAPTWRFRPRRTSDLPSSFGQSRHSDPATPPPVFPARDTPSQDPAQAVVPPPGQDSLEYSSRLDEEGQGSPPGQDSLEYSPRGDGKDEVPVAEDLVGASLSDTELAKDREALVEVAANEQGPPGMDFVGQTSSADVVEDVFEELGQEVASSTEIEEEAVLVGVALTVLRDALGEARGIREEALRVYRSAEGTGVSDLKARVGEVVAQLSIGIEVVERKLQETRS